MSKIEKKIRSYFEDSLKYDDQYENIVSKVNLQRKEKKESFRFMQKRNVLKLAFPCLLVMVAVVLGIVLLGGGTPNVKSAEVAVVQMNVNPSISFVVAEDGTIISVYGENDEGKMLINGEVIIGETLEEAIEIVLKIEKETGYLVSGNVSAGENTILFTIETDEDSVMESLNEKVNSTVATVCEELNVKETLNVVKSKSVDNLVARALELDPTLTEEEARQMETKELLKYISGCQIEKMKIPTEQLEQLYNNFKQQKIVLVERDETKKVIDGLDATYQTLKTTFNEMYNGLLEAQLQLNEAYASWFINEDSVYQQALKSYQDAKVKVIVLENEIAQMPEESMLKPIKELELNGLKAALDLSYQALEVSKKSAEEVIAGLNTVIDSALVKFDEFNNSLPEEVKTVVSNYLQNLENKVNTTKDNAISNFENEYQAELENALTQLKTYKQNLVESLKKTQEQN